MRFAARDGELVAGRDLPGRGAYTCRDERCFERARASRGFARVLRQPVQVRPELVRLYTEGPDGQRRQ